jgi:hypothetical protein
LEALAVELILHPCGAWALREKSLASGTRAGDGGVYAATFLEALSWRVDLLGGVVLEGLHLVAGLCFSSRQVGGCRGSGPEWTMFACRGHGLGNHGEQQFHGAGRTSW